MAPAVFLWLTGAILSLLLLAALILITLMVHLQYRIWKYRNLPSPKMRSHWSSYIFGHANQMNKVRTGEETMDQLTSAWMHEVGPVMVLHVFQRSMVIFATKESIKEFVASGRHFKTPAVYQELHSVLSERFLGNGLVVEHIDHVWAAKRNLFNPAFHRSYLRLSMDQFNLSTDALIKHMNKKAGGTTQVRMLDELSRITMDIIAKVGFSFDCGSLTKENSEFNEAVKSALKGYSYFLRNPFMKFSWDADIAALRKKVRSSIRLLRQTGEQVVKERIESMKNGEDDGPNDILSYVLKATNGLTNKSLGMKEVVDEFVTFFVAGMETTANTLSAVFMHLHQNKEVMERLQEEVKSVIGDRTVIKFEDLGKLEYMSAVIKETLRVTPPIGGSGRIAGHDVEVNGYLIPQGTEVILSICIEHMEEYFPDAKTFRPERFLNRSIEANTWVPFMVGPRSCIGQQFAMMEMKVILARLLQTFNFQWVEGQSTRFTEETTMKLVDGSTHYITLQDGISIDEK